MSTSQSPPPLCNYFNQEKLTQECKDLMSSLPLVTGCTGNSLYQYHGFWFLARQLLGVLNSEKFFQARDSDIIIVTMPKSGTTWLKALAFSLMNREKYPDSKNHPLLTSNPHSLQFHVEYHMTDEKAILAMANMPSPRLFFTHMPLPMLHKSLKSSSCKIVYLCRNPKDTFVSLLHFANKARREGICTTQIEEAFDKFCRGISPFGPFWDHVLGYWRESLENPQRVLFLRYEEMKEQPEIQLKKLACFLCCPFSAEEESRGVVKEILKLCSFDNLSSLEVNKTGILPIGIENKTFFRKGEVGEWKNYLSTEMGEKFDQITTQKLEGFGFKCN